MERATASGDDTRRPCYTKVCEEKEKSSTSNLQKQRLACSEGGRLRTNFDRRESEAGSLEGLQPQEPRVSVQCQLPGRGVWTIVVWTYLVGEAAKLGQKENQTGMRLEPSETPGALYTVDSLTRPLRRDFFFFPFVCHTFCCCSKAGTPSSPPLLHSSLQHRYFAEI